jgi:PAS domain S-box-containing protein
MTIDRESLAGGSETIEALRQSEERFRMLADNMSQLAWTCDTLGNVTWYNRRWLDYTGLAFEDMKGWDWRKVQHPDHVDRVVARVQRSAETGEPWEDTFPLLGKDGRYRWFLSRAVPIRDREGRLVQWFGTNTDVTERKAAEEQIARQAGELRALNERLQELDRLKSEFFSNVSHEFRTPLTLVLAPVQDLLGKSQDAVLTENRAQLMMVQRNGRRLLKLVNTLLDFARIEAGHAHASYESTDISALTADLASNFRSACEHAGLALNVDCPPLAEPALVDRDMWEKVVLNLVSNAFKFTFSGEIAVRVRAAGGGFELSVRDTGVGIPSEELPRMFERFHRVEGARGRSHEGSGIGLALVQELVKLQGGSIAVDSVQGKGTTFTVTIPRGSGHLPGVQVKGQVAASTAARADAYVDEALSWLPGADGAAAAPAAEPKTGARILIADDNADMRGYVQRLLAEEYDVEAVTDGEAALAAARARKPDLVITDLMMPRLDGLGLIRELRGDANLRAVPVIALSARAGEEARIEGLAGGADDYLVKPFSARELLVRVGTLLRSAEIRRKSFDQERRVAMLAAIVESSDDAIISKDLDGIIVTWNTGAERLFGYAAAEAIGRPVTMLMPPDRVDEEPVILARIRRGESVEPYETVRRRKDGSLMDVWLTVSPIIDEQRRVVGASKIARDITERKRAEHALREADRRKDEFLATLSHELRNPLAPIRNAVDLLGYADGNAAMGAQARGILTRQVNNLTRLVDDLLELSRISRGTIVMQKERVSLADVVASALETSRPAIEAAGHVLETRLPEEPVMVHADPVRLAQIFTNLLNNAAKYTPPGGRIWLTVQPVPGDVTVSVRDTGIGIAPEMLPRVFDMFVQAAEGWTHTGLGIGLSLARSLAQMHGGSIEGRSEGLGRGSEFVVRLPTLAQEAASSRAAEAQRRAASGS